MNSLTIAHITIHQDENGRYSLNDLYKASGGENRHRPSLWMANKRTKALIDELRSEQEFLLRNKSSGREFLLAPVAVEATGNPSTYVVKELVYDYAMWISPAFELKVIRAYDALMRGDLETVNREIYLRDQAYFEKYPLDRQIRRMAMQSEPYWYIGVIVRRAASTVGKAVRRMIQWRVMDEDRLRIARIGSSIMYAHRRKYRQQLQLF